MSIPIFKFQKLKNGISLLIEWKDIPQEINNLEKGFTYQQVEEVVNSNGYQFSTGAVYHPPINGIITYVVTLKPRIRRSY